MDGLLGGLIAILVWMLILPIIFLAVLVGLAAAGIGLAIGLVAQGECFFGVRLRLRKRTRCQKSPTE